MPVCAALPRFNGRDVLTAVLADVAQFVQLRVEAARMVPPSAKLTGGSSEMAVRILLADIRDRIDQGGAEPALREYRSERDKRRQLRERPAERQQFARRGRVQGDFGEQALQILDAARAPSADRPRTMILLAEFATASSRASISPGLQEGFSSRCRSSRPPMPVQVLSST